MRNYSLDSTAHFEREMKRLKKDRRTYNLVIRRLAIITNNPFDISLRTHQVNVPSLGKVWSSRVNGDIRVIWEFDENDELVIIALRVDGHDGVYS
ncbi:MAG: hypothetical protein ABI721_05000 [Candidatus Dojkabacteria bacterium]